MQARSQGGRWGRSPPPQKKMQKKKKEKKGERERKRKIKLRVCVKLPPFNHFQSKIKYKFVLYEENTGHMHQIAPLTTSKCNDSFHCGRGKTPLPHPPPRSLRSLARYFYRPPPLKLNPGYASNATELM